MFCKLRGGVLIANIYEQLLYKVGGESVNATGFFARRVGYFFLKDTIYRFR